MKRGREQPAPPRERGNVTRDARDGTMGSPSPRGKGETNSTALSLLAPSPAYHRGCESHPLRHLHPRQTSLPTRRAAKFASVCAVFRPDLMTASMPLRQLPFSLWLLFSGPHDCAHLVRSLETPDVRPFFKARMRSEFEPPSPDGVALCSNSRLPVTRVRRLRPAQRFAFAPFAADGGRLQLWRVEVDDRHATRIGDR
jgi:hypothetical protein